MSDFPTSLVCVAFWVGTKNDPMGWASPIVVVVDLFLWLCPTVDGSEILHQLRLVIYPIRYTVLFILSGAGFLLPTVVQMGCKMDGLYWKPY